MNFALGPRLLSHGLLICGVTRGPNSLSLLFFFFFFFFFHSHSGYNVGTVAYECQHYRLLTESDRNINSGTLFGKCDNNLAGGWYRISGAAGSQMTNSCPGPGRCNTQYPGWLFGSHPHKYDGCVEMLVCFGDYFSGCCQHRRKVLVRNCGGFYVYKLGPTSGCNFRYCGRDAPPPPSTMGGLL